MQDGTPSLSDPSGAPPELAAHDGQGDLFAASVALREEIERAIARGDFREAHALGEALRRDHDESLLGDSAFLEVLARWSWDAVDLDEAVATWRSAVARVSGVDRRRQLVDAFFMRLSRCVDPEVAAARHASWLVDLVNAHWRRGDARLGRLIVRDALLRGDEVMPGEIEDDAVRRVLIEPLGPAWLACEGAIQRAWPAPPLSSAERDSVAAALATPLPEADHARGLAFWECLRVALSPSMPEEHLHAARRRMKALDADLRARFTGDAPPGA